MSEICPTRRLVAVVLKLLSSYVQLTEKLRLKCSYHPMTEVLNFVDMNDWTPETGRAMAEVDGVELDDVKWSQILKARE